MWGLGFSGFRVLRVWGYWLSGFRVWVKDFRGLGFEVKGFEGLGFEVRSLFTGLGLTGFRVKGRAFRVWG